MPELNGGHLFIRCLKQEGVQKVFTIVGDTILPLVDAAADEGIEFIDARHEGAAMHMADGYARITGQPAVAMFTGGPGFANAISGLPAIYTSESPGHLRGRLCRTSRKGPGYLPGNRPGGHGRPGVQGVVADPRKEPHPGIRRHRLPHCHERAARPGASDPAHRPAGSPHQRGGPAPLPTSGIPQHGPAPGRPHAD